MLKKHTGKQTLKKSMFHCALFEMTLWVILSKGLFEWLYSALAPFWWYCIIYSHEAVKCSYSKVKDNKSCCFSCSQRRIEKIDIFCVFKHTYTKAPWLSKDVCTVLFLSCLPTHKTGCYHIKAVAVKSAHRFCTPTHSGCDQTIL